MNGEKCTIFSKLPSIHPLVSCPSTQPLLSYFPSHYPWAVSPEFSAFGHRAKQPLGQTGQGTRGKIPLGDKCLSCRDPLGIRKVIKAFSGSFLHWTTPNQKELPGKTFTLKSTFLFSSFCVLQFYSNTTSLACNFSITVAPQQFFIKNLI